MQSVKYHQLWEKHYPGGVTWDQVITPESMGALFDQAVEKFSLYDAIEFFGTTITYETLALEVKYWEHKLSELGVKKGSRVAILLPNVPQFIMAYFALLKRGAVVINCNPLYTQRELEEQLINAEATMIITLDIRLLYNKALYLKNAGVVNTLVVASFTEYLPSIKRQLFWLLKSYRLKWRINGEGIYQINHVAFSKDLDVPKIEPKKDVAIMQYTGGTTGTPKGAMLTHGNIVVNTKQVGLLFGEEFDEGAERLLCVLPLFHAFAMTALMNLSMHKGCCLVLHPRLDIKLLLKDIVGKKITIMMGVPALFTAIINHKKSKPSMFKSLKTCISGGAPLPAALKDEFESLAGCSLVEGYGLTETSPVASVNPLFGTNKKGSAGIPLPGTDISIYHKDDRTKITTPNTIGEIAISGPQVMKGYYKAEKETKAVLTNNRLFTGDLGYMDKDGFVYIVDRLKEMIISSGFNVYPREIEEEIYAHPAVEEAAVIGVADKKKGQAIKALIKTKHGASVNEVDMRGFLKSRLAGYKQPKIIEFVDDLPKTIIGKIEKKSLK